MVTRVAYREERFKSSDDCLSAIRDSVALGWQVSEVRGKPGQFVVLFRMDEPMQLADIG